MLVLSIVLGAFGAHGLRNLISIDRLQTFEVGVRYQWYGSLSLLVLALCSERIPFSLQWFNRLTISGIILFSGSIYLISLSELLPINPRILGPITPIGGAMMILGWIIFIIGMLRVKS